MNKLEQNILDTYRENFADIYKKLRKLERDLKELQEEYKDANKELKLIKEFYCLQEKINEIVLRRLDEHESKFIYLG